jgi:hypothetical protein
MWCATVLQGIEHRADRQPRHECYGGTSSAQRAGSRTGVCRAVSSSCSSSGGGRRGRGAGEALCGLKGLAQPGRLERAGLLTVVAAAAAAAVEGEDEDEEGQHVGCCAVTRDLAM